MNATMEKFGYPATLIAETAHWVVLLRPAQPTLGALVLAAKSDAHAFGALDPAAYAELATVTAAIETMLDSAVSFEKINYLMLMMVDPHVHCHVVPRYSGSRERHGVTYADAGWPRLPELGVAVTLDEVAIADIVGWLKGYWPG